MINKIKKWKIENNKNIRNKINFMIKIKLIFKSKKKIALKLIFKEKSFIEKKKVSLHLKDKII
jgi:hypothetical protein